MTRTVEPGDWNPGLLHDERLLGEVTGSLPGYDPADVPAVIRLFENPASGWSLPGAITLARHDALHAVLGRGLSLEDEAFVIGYTMGASDGTENAMTAVLRLLAAWNHRREGRRAVDRRVRDMQVSLYEWIACRLYPAKARFTDIDIVAFRLGLGAGERSRTRNLELLPLDEWGHRTLGEVREACGIDVDGLESIYRAEQAMIGGHAAARLDTGYDIDNARIGGDPEPPVSPGAGRGYDGGPGRE